MRLAISVQERPSRDALIVEVNCANRTRKPVMDAARSSARRAFSVIKRSTLSLPTGNVGSAKELKAKECNPTGLCPSFTLRRPNRVVL